MVLSPRDSTGICPQRIQSALPPPQSYYGGNGLLWPVMALAVVKHLQLVNECEMYSLFDVLHISPVVPLQLETVHGG